MRTLSLVLLLGTLAWAALSLSPRLPDALAQAGSWPSGTQFALLDAQGQVVWTPGAAPTQEALRQAVALRITLPGGEVYLVTVQVQGSGQGLGEVWLTVGDKRVPLPELLHAKGFAVADGQIVREPPAKGPAAPGNRGHGRGR